MSGAFKSVSFSLTEIGKPGSQVWMKVSLLGGMGSPGSLLAHDQEQVKEETLFLFEPPMSSHVFSHRRRNRLWNMIIIYSFYSRIT